MEWYSLSWFEPETLRGFSWGQRLFLYGLPVIPLLFVVRWLLFVRFRQKLSLSLPGRAIGWSLTAFLRFVPDVLAGLADSTGNRGPDS